MHEDDILQHSLHRDTSIFSEKLRAFHLKQPDAAMWLCQPHLAQL